MENEIGRKIIIKIETVTTRTSIKLSNMMRDKVPEVIANLGRRSLRTSGTL